MWLRNRLLLFWWAENRENYSVCSLVAEYLNVCCGLTQLCNAFEWYTTEYLTSHLCFCLSIQRKYEWDTLRYIVREHCMTVLYHAIESTVLHVHNQCAAQWEGSVEY